MASPLSPRSQNALNIVSQPVSLDESLKLPSPKRQHSALGDDLSMVDSAASSPFQTEVETDAGQENRPPLASPMTPSRARATQSKGSKLAIFEDSTVSPPPLPPSDITSCAQRYLSSLSSKATPCKVPLPPSSPSKEFPDETPMRPAFQSKGEDTFYSEEAAETKSVASDDTGFTAFSAVPDMTLFAKLGKLTPGRGGRSPRKEDQTPSAHVFTTPSTSRRQPLEPAKASRAGSPPPRAAHIKDGGDTTNLLLDFTGQFDGIAPSRTPRKMATEPNLLQHINHHRMPSPTKGAPRTPSRRNMLNLLDFDLPPQPTPRSLPTVTVRELESLKSQYLSEISSLKASLSGREAEVTSLKKAVGDAERRVGEAEESLRDERSAREHAENLKVEWEKKGKEVESALRKFKEEFLAEEKEKEELLQKLDEATQAREEAELKASEATRNAAVAQSDFDGRSSNPDAMEALVAQRVASQLDAKMENLARELHQVYKKKHESKVASLKKNYEIRAEKHCAELQTRVEQLVRQNEDLQSIREGSLSLELPNGKMPSVPEESKRLLEEQKSQLQQHEATIAGLREEMSSVRRGHAALVEDLERERVEKGELVAAVDEMLALQAEAPPGTPQQTAIVEDFKKSIGVANRPGSVGGAGMGSLRAPGSSVGGFGLRAPSTLPGRSGQSSMRSNIQRMGGGR